MFCFSSWKSVRSPYLYPKRRDATSAITPSVSQVWCVCQAECLSILTVSHRELETLPQRDSWLIAVITRETCGRQTTMWSGTGGTELQQECADVLEGWWQRRRLKRKKKKKHRTTISIVDSAMELTRNTKTDGAACYVFEEGANGYSYLSMCGNCTTLSGSAFQFSCVLVLSSLSPFSTWIWKTAWIAERTGPFANEHE